MKERPCKLTIAWRQCYDSQVSCKITGHAGQGALPANDRAFRISEYYRPRGTLVFKTNLLASRRTADFSRQKFYEYTWLKGDL